MLEHQFKTYFIMNVYSMILASRMIATLWFIYRR